MGKERRSRDGSSTLPSDYAYQHAHTTPNIPIRTIRPHSISLFSEERIVQVLLGADVGLEHLDGLDTTSPTIGLFEQ